MSSYPARCTVDLERRLLPSEIRTTWEAELGELVALVAPPAHAEFEVPFMRNALEQPADMEFARHVLDAAGTVLGSMPEIGAAPYWTDAALLSEAGIPAVVFGPGGGGIHSHDEWVDLTTMDACRQTLLSVIESWCR